VPGPVGGDHRHVDGVQHGVGEPLAGLGLGRQLGGDAGLPAPFEQGEDHPGQVLEAGDLLAGQLPGHRVEDTQGAQRVSLRRDQRRRGVEPHVGEHPGDPGVVAVGGVGAGVADVDELPLPQPPVAHRVGAGGVTTGETRGGELALTVLVDQVEGRGGDSGDHRGDPDDRLQFVVGGCVEHAVLVQRGQALLLVSAQHPFLSARRVQPS
jgi:hypothetical protein